MWRVLAERSQFDLRPGLRCQAVAHARHFAKQTHWRAAKPHPMARTWGDFAKQTQLLTSRESLDRLAATSLKAGTRFLESRVRRMNCFASLLFRWSPTPVEICELARPIVI